MSSTNNLNNQLFMIKETLNARRLLCPLPVIRTQDKVKQLKAGDLLEVICTDPGVMQDIPAWCRINGHKVVETSVDNHEYIIILEVGS
jgi:TusA-related sulfurtransferase